MCSEPVSNQFPIQIILFQEFAASTLCQVKPIVFMFVFRELYNVFKVLNFMKGDCATKANSRRLEPQAEKCQN